MTIYDLIFKEGVKLSSADEIFDFLGSLGCKMLGGGYMGSIGYISVHVRFGIDPKELNKCPYIDQVRVYQR